jgi:hypothetical protein
MSEIPIRSSSWRASGSSAPGRGTGKELVQATWQLLRQDPDLMWLPVLGGMAAFAALLILFVPGLLLGWATGNLATGGVLGGILGIFLASSVAIYFQAALVLGAFQRADGYDPSLGSTLRQAWGVRRQVVQWALLTTTVGIVIRTIEQRLGILGTILGFLGGLAWAIASFFTVPVLVAEGLGPVAATRRSALLIKQRWGISLRSTLRVGVLEVVATFGCMAVFFIGLYGAMVGDTFGLVVGGLIMALAVLALFATAMIAAAVMGYARALLYRYAVGLPVPGIPAELYAGVFVPKRRGLRGR